MGLLPLPALMRNLRQYDGERRACLLHLRLTVCNTE
jgi:hypothetical protein